MAIRPEFAVHRLNALGMAKAEGLAEAFSQLLSSIEAVMGSQNYVADGPPTGAREIALVRTKLEEAAFFAKRAIAVRPENQAYIGSVPAEEEI